MATVDELVVRIQADMSQLKQQLATTKKITDDTAKKMRGGFRSVGDATKNLTNQFSLMKTAIAGLGLGFLANSVIRSNAEMEDLQRTLTTVMGTAKQGKAAFEFINIFAQRTPFDIQTLTRAFIQLKGAGIEPTQKLLTTLGNAASVTTDKVGAFESLVRITTRSVGGGLGLEELEQLVSKGIPVYKILEDQLGITRQGVTELGQSAEGAAKIMNALNESFDIRFPTAMADASSNLSVQLSNLGIAINNAFLALGKGGLNDEIKSTVTAITDATTQSRSFLTVLGGALSRTIRFVRLNFDNLVIAITALVGIKTARWALTTGIAMIKLATTIARVTRASAIFGLISRTVFSKKGIAGVLILGTVLASFRKQLESSIEKMSDFFKDLVPSVDKALSSVKEFFGFAENESVKDLDQDLKNLEDQFVSNSKTVSKFTGNLKDLDTAFGRFRPVTEELTEELKKYELLLENLESKQIKNTEAIDKTKVVITGLKDEIKLAQPEFTALKNATESLGNSISDSLASAFVNGKLQLEDFKGFFKSFVQEIISQGIKLMAINPIINSIFGLTGRSALPTGSLQGFTSIFGGGSGAIGATAGGGAVQARRPTLVGERGPELFIPNTGGVVRNNMDTRGMMGGGQVNNVYQNFNISAGVAQTVRAEVLGMMPLIKEQTLNAVVDQKQRGGAFASALS